MPGSIDQREFATRVQELMKCAQTDPEAAISLLEGLHREAAPTENMLRNTKAGVVVNRLRANTNTEISRLATDLVAKWRRMIEVEKARNRARAAASASAASASVSASASPAAAAASTLSPGADAAGAAAAAAALEPAAAAAALEPASAATSEEMRRPFCGDPEKRNARNDGVDTICTKSQERNKFIMLLYNGLSFRSTESVAAVLARAIELEEAAIRAYNGPTRQYMEKARSLMLNLKNKTNRALGERVMSGDISPARFVVMTAEDLKSEELRALEDEMERENMKKAQVPMGEQAIAPGRQCNKCKEHMVSYVQAQTRSADEPMTTFFTCSVCGHRWKE